MDHHIGYVPLNVSNDCNTLCIIPPKVCGRREQSFDVLDKVTVRDPLRHQNIGGSEWAVTKTVTCHQKFMNFPSHYL